MTYGNRTVHQTMLNTAAMVISRSRYPEGVNIVLLAKLSDDDCYQKTVAPDIASDNRTMRVVIVIQPLTEDPLVSTGLVFAFYLGTCESHSTYTSPVVLVKKRFLFMELKISFV